MPAHKKTIQQKKETKELQKIPKEKESEKEEVFKLPTFSAASMKKIDEINLLLIYSENKLIDFSKTIGNTWKYIIFIYFLLIFF